MQIANHQDQKQVIYLSQLTHFDHMLFDKLLTTFRNDYLEVWVIGNLICNLDVSTNAKGPFETVYQLCEKMLTDDRHTDIV